MIQPPSRPSPTKPTIAERLRPETDQEATLLSGLGLIVAGFLLAQLLGSILYAPLSLLVPGGVLTFVGLLAHTTEGPP